MSLQIAAQHLSSQGRGKDSTLVHMSPREVSSLNAIAKAHGGQLSINPNTGLPEAGFLESILPMVAGAALTATGVGAPMAALLVGGGYGAATGSLKKGLMAGLGAYGGAGLGDALAQSGMQAEAAAATAAQPPMTHTPLAPSIVPDATTSSFGSQGFGNPALQNPALAQAQTAFQGGTMGQNLETMGKGISSLGSGAGRSAFMTNLGNVPDTFGPKTTMLAAAAPTIAEAMKPGEPTPKTPVDSDPGQQYTYEANLTSPTPMSAPYGQEQKYFNQRYVKRAADGGMMASGGISDAQYNLGGYSDGGRLLRGPGDGVSDSIPAVIGKKQPARLADGEFVVPARIVSELGNGSTEAGARKLYAMMDRIQSARGKTVGKGKVAKNSRSEKHLPA
jgi:hypothetical protein